MLKASGELIKLKGVDSAEAVKRVLKGTICIDQHPQGKN